MAEEQEEPKFGSPTPFAEPSWYDPRNSTPYYTEHHKKFRATLREFVDKDVNPHVEEWEAAGEIPIEVYRKAGQIGLLQAAIGWPSEEVPGLPHTTHPPLPRSEGPCCRIKD